MKLYIAGLDGQGAIETEVSEISDTDWEKKKS